MIITMIAVPVVQMARNEVIGVIPVRHLLVVAVAMRAIAVNRCMVGRISRADGNAVLVVVALVLAVQMAVVQVIDMSVVPHAGVAAVLAVNVRVVVM